MAVQSLKWSESDRCFNVVKSSCASKQPALLVMQVKSAMGPCESRDLIGRAVVGGHRVNMHQHLQIHQQTQLPLCLQKVFFFLLFFVVCARLPDSIVGGQGKRLGHSRLRKSRNEAHLDKEMKFHLPELFALDAQLDVFSRQSDLHSGFFLRF